MKILLITQKNNCKDKSDAKSVLLRDLEKRNYFKINRDKLAHMFLGDTSEISIQEDNLINYTVKSTGDNDVNIPNLNPVAVREIFNFFNDYNADIVNSYDDGFLGILAQVWAIQKKVPFVFTESDQKLPVKTRTSKLFQFLVKSSGIGNK